MYLCPDLTVGQQHILASHILCEILVLKTCTTKVIPFQLLKMPHTVISAVA